VLLYLLQFLKPNLMMMTMTFVILHESSWQLQVHLSIKFKQLLFFLFVLNVSAVILVALRLVKVGKE